MGQRRLARVATSDDDDDDNSPPPMSPNKEEEQRHLRKRKKMKLIDEDDEEEEHDRGRNKKKIRKEEEEPTKSADEDENKEEEEREEQVEDAKPIGDVIKASGRGRGKRNHYKAFEYDGLQYELEDPVLLVPEETTQKPYVAIIKDITQTTDGSMMVNGQWFYRPEEAQKKSGGNWQSRDTRELFYSFHRDEVPAESVMHKCVVHFIPLHKQIPHRKQHPGFIVQKVYDTEQSELFKLTDKDYEDSKQDELDILVQKTLSRLGDVPDIETEGTSADQDDRSRNKRMLRKKNMALLDVSRDDEETTKSGHNETYGETPRSVTSNASEYSIILAKYQALTGEMQRDGWLERILPGFQFIRTPTGNEQGEDEGKSIAHGSGLAGDSSSKSDDSNFVWPDSAVHAVSALEKAAHDTLSADLKKYHKKMRQLMFNLKNNQSLSRRLLNGELEPATILNMSPVELKVGLTAEEIAIREPEKSEHMQMTEVRCRRCMEQNVGIFDIIQASRGERYQLLCNACGNTWYVRSDELAMSATDAPVGTADAPLLAIEDVDKSKEAEEYAAGDVMK